ncbi:hypothetical protein B0A55_03853 [Friedmanniomyces simplex]|uniref:Diphthamide biosynthesis protein 3 n=1 Tax=Friedmanniomyces simplex TaxID=329884 RepID=A0A4U0XFD0_9PEZI|nr:hypothetical protein B0A55_03853 [Friedmanniomyces simplex]
MAATADNIYDEIEIEDMTYDATLQIYHYPCPCGDRFEISLDDLREGETDIGVCPSCSLQIRVIYEIEDLPRSKEAGPEGQKGAGTVMSEQQIEQLAEEKRRAGGFPFVEAEVLALDAEAERDGARKLKVMDGR